MRWFVIVAMARGAARVANLSGCWLSGASEWWTKRGEYIGEAVWSGIGKWPSCCHVSSSVSIGCQGCVAGVDRVWWEDRRRCLDAQASHGDLLGELSSRPSQLVLGNARADVNKWIVTVWGRTCSRVRGMSWLNRPPAYCQTSLAPVHRAVVGSINP
jgi:hypothetical protein